MRSSASFGPRLPASLLQKFQLPSQTRKGGTRDGRRNDKKQGRRVDGASKKSSQFKKAGSHGIVRRRNSQPASNKGGALAERENSAKTFDGDDLGTASSDTDEDANISHNLDESKSALSVAERQMLDQDDAEIAKLEKRLGINGNEKTKKSLQDDGLDSLLGGEDLAEDNQLKRKRADDLDWLQRKRSKSTKAETSGMHSPPYELNEVSLENYSEGDESAEYESESSVQNESRALISHERTRMKENPYVPPVNANNTGKYVAPTRREIFKATDADSDTRLQRRIQGLLNRFSGTNILSIAGEIDKLYQDNARQYVTKSLVTAISNAICDQSILSESFVNLHAGLVAVLCRVTGPDLGAQILQHSVQVFDGYYKAPEAATDGKRTMNLISFISFLYTFNVSGATLVFDYIRWFLDETSERNTELLLRILRAAGSQLRIDDPTALRDIAILLQRNVAKVSEEAISVRTRFMMESIVDLRKNGKLKGAAMVPNAIEEQHARIKKQVMSLHGRVGKSIEPLQATLADLREEQKRGKWWLVGASWKNENGYDDAATKDKDQTPAQHCPQDAQQNAVSVESGELLAIAKMQRMNTDIRRAIFVAVVGASDYVDAHDRIRKLNLTRTQEQQIPYVILRCAGTEAVYNPYYAMIARKLCDGAKIKKAFQYALGHTIKKLERESTNSDEPKDDIDTSSMHTLINHAKFFASLVSAGCLTLAGLWASDFAHLSSRAEAFMEVLLVHVLLPPKKDDAFAEDDTKLLDMFASVKSEPELSLGLGLFLRTKIADSDLTKHRKSQQKLLYRGQLVAEYLTTTPLVE